MKNDKFDLLLRGDDNDFFGFPFFDIGYNRKHHDLMRTDVKETENNYELTVDLPGFKKEDVHVDLEDGYLTISAKREHSHDEKDKKGSFIRRERSYGEFSRKFYVGDVNESDIDAHLENGILSINLPKEKKLPNKSRIEIK